jgi:hypothetical protein
VKFLRNNGLSLALAVLFVTSFFGQGIAGWKAYNQHRAERDEPTATFSQFVRMGEFWASVSENWESEFLQIGFVLILTTHLYQRGSKFSKDPLNPEPPQPRRGWVRDNGLFLVCLSFFAVSWTVHLIAGSKAYSDEQVEDGLPPVTPLQYLTRPKFWFESLENWQSQFLAMLCMCVLTIFLRQRGSAESKRTDTANWEHD